MIRIKDTQAKMTLKAAVLSVFLLFVAVAGFGQQTINLTAAPTSTTLPDGTVVPMWGYFCGAVVTGSTATCAALNPLSTTTVPATWSPVVITVPTGAAGGLQVNLTNDLTFTPTGATTANTVPTSIVIVGQVGGGLGGAPTTTASPNHSLAQGCATWFIASGATPPGTPCPAAQTGASGTPPLQQMGRVQSMGTEVAVGATPAALVWKSLKPGTYLLESGTHPSIQVPMGLIGILVVTTAPSGTTAGSAYPGAAATTTPAVAAIPAVPYNAELPLEFSEIDPVQNKAVATAVNTAGFSETRVWSGMTGQCGNPGSPVGVVNTCYPPAVNYTPFYYLINGVAFSKTNAAASLFAATAGVTTGTTTPVTTGITGTVLVRLVNAGLRMHVPSIVGSLTQGFNGSGVATTVGGFTLIAEDGNVLPNVAPPGATTVPAAPRVQTDVFMAAGKTYDVLVNVPATPTGATAPPSLPIFDRELSLSANSSVRDAGMVAYIGVNGAALPVAAGSGPFGAAVARADTYNSLVAGQPLSVSDPSKGVIANDTNVYGVTLLAAPASGTLTCNAQAQFPVAGICANGTFTYTPSGTATSDTFTYCANGSVTGTTCSSGITATVTLGASSLTGNPTAISHAYTANTSAYFKMPSPGLLIGNSDPNNLSLSIVPTTATNVTMDAAGGFTVTNPAPTAGGSVAFSYTVTNSQGRTASGTATVNFPTPSNLNVKVLDAQAFNNCNGLGSCISGLTPITDYRWIIEEDKTFWTDPNCTTNTGSATTTAGCPAIVGPSGQSTIPTFGVQFHTSTMDFVAQGCTGPLSCEGGQMVLNPTTGIHVLAVCDQGNGACRPDPSGGNGTTPVLPSQVHLDPTKRYYISILPGDAANPFPSYAGAPGCSTTTGAQTAPGNCGHTMSGAPVPPACNMLVTGCTSTSTTAFAPVNVLVLPTPLPTGKLSVIVFEDDFPLNGEQDGGGGNGTIAPIEPGLGGFNLVLWDTYGGLGDVTGQNTYDMFNQPLSNSLAGTIDPVTGIDACPVSATPLVSTGNTGAAGTPGTITGNGAGNGQPGGYNAGGMTGMIVTCPKYEADGTTLSPLAGQAIVANLMPEKFSVQAYPGADRIARGEEWIQTNTLDGQHAHDSFIRIGEPSYFQEYGPAGFHVAIGFANPAIINARTKDVCAGNGSPGTVGPCTNTITGVVNGQRLSRIPDERLYPSGSRDALAWTQCWVSLGDPDGEDFMFTKCDAAGNFKFTGVPGGFWRLTIGDQWNDQIIDGLSTPANVGCTSSAPGSPTNATTCPGGQTLPMGNIGVQQWQANLYTRTFIDKNKNGIYDADDEGIPLIYTMIHYRDGHNSNALTTDFNGIANFNETFPLFNWYVVEADDTRYKTTGIHTVYDAGGPADGSGYCGNGTTARQCGTSTAYNYLTNTYESVPLPADLSVPGAVYCASADCAGQAGSFAAGTAVPSSGSASTGRIDPPWVWGEGFSGLTGQNNWIDFGKAPYAACNPSLPVSATNFCATVTSTAPGATAATTTMVGENGGIGGMVAYASTRPFDDASQMIQQPWEPNVPRVTVNLYQEGFAADGVTKTLKLVDTTQSASWDDWAQGFYPSSTAGTGTGVGQKPYMSCPGQGTATGTNADLFYFTLYDQPNYLDWYNAQHNGGTLHTLPYNSQFKCYDAMKINNQIQPAPYDGKYHFPSTLGVNPTTGKLLTTMGSTNGVASSMAGTNCTICVPNPDSTDPYRHNTPMLPPGKYTVEVIMPPGYEVYKEEDKNLLIGDNFIAPVTQQFGGLGTDIFIIPDQASVASMYDESGAGFNPSNYQDSTTAFATNEELSGVPGFPGYTDPVWPCVGEMRVVPDYLSLFPGAKEVAPFAGATRPLCDRKEVTLANQMAVSARFFIFTSTHIASKFTGVITDDFTSEFDPFSPQFGEKFAPPSMPISTKDYLGNEISRVYADHWGVYDGLIFSSWEVNPPNITGYSPNMMVQCMNDPGPILDTRAQIPNPASPGTMMANPNFGLMVQDPLYQAAYSDFCYEEPYMPGLTTYLDTPVVPTQAFVGAAYNNVDCAYPDATPAVKEVDGDAIGPWVAAAGNSLTITALGDQQVNNAAYSGPSASVAPFNMKTVTRHYGFGTRCTTAAAGSTTCNTVSSVTIGGMAATITGWTDTQILVTVPTGVPNCAIQQQAQYGGSLAQCGELVITAGNGKQSIDAVTVTIGGKQPVHISANQTIQGAIDNAAPGDMLIVDPTCMTVATTTAPAAQTTCSSAAIHATTATQTASQASHSEMVLMWKPVRLQGVGAPSSIIDANAIPAGKLLDPWRRHVNCLFGLSLQGVPLGQTTTQNPTPIVYNPDPLTSSTITCPDAGWKYFGSDLTGNGNGTPNTLSPQIDRIPLEAVVGWDATQNGNLAEQLQEPSLMGAYEGAGITALGKGVDTHGVSPWTDGNEGGAFPTGTTLLTGVGPNPLALAVGDANPLCLTSGAAPNPNPSNYMCNPSSIDGLTIRDSSQGGGGIFLHGWTHHTDIGNNRVYNNAGTLTGGISVGQGEFPTAYVQGSTTNSAPGSCSDGTGFVTNQHLPYCLQIDVNVHNNSVTNNSSLGDELFSGTLSGSGGVTACTGADYYKFAYNWICGNLTTGEGGGVVHLGESQNGDIEHNTIALNQSDNPTIATNGGGIQVMGTPDTDPVCGTQIDTDCPPGLSDGTGHNLTINANLIQGNMAESGGGGGIRLQQVNGTDVSTFPTQPTLWNNVSITNNIIVNNVAGWDGGGISLQDAMNVAIVSNTIISNDTLASSGVLTQSLGTPDASAPPGSCTNAAGTTSCPTSAGVTSTPNSSLMATAIGTATLTCPFGQAGCAGFSNPLFQNNLVYQNRSFYVGVGGLGTGTQNQQNLVTLFNASGAAAPTQTASGACGAASYWDIGVRGDTGPGNHGSGFTLNPTYSFLDDTGYAASNSAANPAVVAQYCNGSRVPPECTAADGCAGPHGFGVPPGIADALTPNPVFGLVPNATVDEGNNWINVSWGPLSLANDAVTGGANANYGGGNPLGNYAITPGSPAENFVPVNTTTLPTATIPTLAQDFFGNPRPDPSSPSYFDVGAVEIGSTASATAVLDSISPNSGADGTTVNVTLTGSNLGGATGVAFTGGGGGGGITISNFVAVNATTVTATFTIAANAAQTARNVVVTTAAGNSNAVTFTVTAAPVATLTSIVPATELRGTSVLVTLTGSNFATGDTVAIAPAATGVTVSGVTVVSSTSITATISSTTAAAIGSVNVEVVSTSGASNTLPFAITGPVLTSIVPSTTMRNSTGVTVTLTGSGLTGTTAVNFSGNGITVTAFTVASDTTVNATINIAANATAGARNVTVTAPGGTSNPVTFTVTVPPAGLFSISPTTGARGTAQPVVLTGISLTGATSVNVTGGGITVSGVTVVSDTQVNATFTIAPTAALTARNVTVTTPTGTTTPVTFTVVNPGTPILNSITPNSGFRRTAAAANPVAVVLGGSNFTAGSTVNVVAPANGLTVTGVTVVSPTQINATFNTTTTAVIGPRSITVTNPGGTSGPVTYTVKGPVLTSITPASGNRGNGAIPVSIFGSGLTGATAVTVSGNGATVGAITVISDTQINTTFTFSATATLTARNVTVTAPGGVSNTVAFTVTAPASPSLSSIAPASGVRGTAVAVTINGNDFVSGFTTVAVSGGGITISNVNVVNPTQLTATFTITAGATLSARNVTVTVTGAAAASNAVTFTVTGATLAFSTPSPALNGGGTTAKGPSTITVTNSGTGSFTFSAAPSIAKASGTGNGTFAITGGTCSSTTVLTPTTGNTCTIIVTYSGETNASTANGRITLTGTGSTAATVVSGNIPAN